MNSTRTKVFIFASDVSSLVGHSKFHPHKAFERLWKKVDSAGYKVAVDLATSRVAEKRSQLAVLASEREALLRRLYDKEIDQTLFDTHDKQLTAKETSLHLETTHLEHTVDSIMLSQSEKIAKDLGQELSNTLQDPSLGNADKKKAVVAMLKATKETKTGRALDDAGKDALRQEAVSLINRTHGITHEDNALRTFEKQYSCTLDTSQKFFAKSIVKTCSREYFVCGKMDGINHDCGYVVEAKNRTSSFFNTLRQYENTQMQLYMLLTDLPLTKLVERLRNKIKITDVARDDAYIADVTARLTAFIHAFERFVDGDETEKIAYVLQDDDERGNTFYNTFIHALANKPRPSPNERQPRSECLL